MASFGTKGLCSEVSPGAPLALALSLHQEYLQYGKTALRLGQATRLPSTYKGDKMAFSDLSTVFCPLPPVLTSGHSREA